MQRYLTGRSIAQSRLSLLFNAVAKIPMQFFILFIGAMVFVFYLFVQPPLLFEQAELQRIQAFGRLSAGGASATRRRSTAGARRRWTLVEAHHAAGCRAAKAARWPNTGPRRLEMDEARVQAAEPGGDARAARRDSATPTTSSSRL